MKRATVALAVGLLVAMATTESWAQKRGVGRGGARTGSRVPPTRQKQTRPGNSIRTPSMSRAKDNKKNLPPGNRVPPATRPGNEGDVKGNLPGNSKDRRPGDVKGNLPGTDPGRRPGDVKGNLPGTSRPTRDDLDSFLDLPGEPGRPQRGDLKERVGDNRPGINPEIDRKEKVDSIRDKWNDRDDRPFDGDWWAGHRHHHHGHHWHWHRHWVGYPHYWCWQPCTWGAFGRWFVWRWTTPVYYVYGTTVVYRDNYVYIDSQQVATETEYYQQADMLADSVPAEAEESDIEWLPLGVFAISELDATDTGMLLQLAVSKEGIIAGTFYNEITDTSRPVEGMVDRETQKAAWKFSDGKNPEIVMETPLANLTEDESTALIHYGADKTQTWHLIRLPAPEGE